MTGEPEDLAALGRRMREARRQAALSLGALAEDARVKPAALGSWERGDRDPGIGGLLSVSRALGVTVACLLGESEDKPNEREEAAS